MIDAPEFLPLGSVVTIQGSDVEFMIVCRGMVLRGDDGEKTYYDYGTVVYPQGLVGEAVVYTNHDLITSVLHEGYSNDLDKEYISELVDVLGKVEDIEKGNPVPKDTW